MITGTTTLPTVMAEPSTTVPAKAATTPAVPEPADRISVPAITPTRATVTAAYGPTRAIRVDAAGATTLKQSAGLGLDQTGGDVAHDGRQRGDGGAQVQGEDEYRDEQRGAAGRCADGAHDAFIVRDGGCWLRRASIASPHDVLLGTSVPPGGIAAFPLDWATGHDGNN